MSRQKFWETFNKLKGKITNWILKSYSSNQIITPHNDQRFYLLLMINRFCKNNKSSPQCYLKQVTICSDLIGHHTANILAVLTTAFGSVTFPTVIWLCMLPPKTEIDLKLYSSLSLSVTGTAVGCDQYCQITLGSVTQPMTVNWL